MSDYNDGKLPDPCLRLDTGFGQQYKSIELGDGTGYVRLDMCILTHLIAASVGATIGVFVMALLNAGKDG